eukprot:1148783-Pelagomonas_calceolata.AAC.5
MIHVDVPHKCMIDHIRDMYELPEFWRSVVAGSALGVARWPLPIGQPAHKSKNLKQGRGKDKACSIQPADWHEVLIINMGSKEHSKCCSDSPDHAADLGSR